MMQIGLLLDFDHFLIVTLNILIVFSVIWILLQKKKVQHNFLLTKSEEEELITAYDPEDLVEKISSPHRCLKPSIIKGKIGEFINVGGVVCVNFSTHDYLGFIGKKEIEDRAVSNIKKYGVGTCGPRCFLGTNIVHLELERKLADFLDTESSIIYPLGFATISSAIPAYAKKGDIIFTDEKSNFAIQQGLVASKSEVMYFKHNSYEDLERILKTIQITELLNLKKARRQRKILVLEGIYINTGNICPLLEFISVSKEYKLRIFIDDSISLGVLGKNGKGILEHFDVSRAEVDLTIGSFEHSLASVGGFCAGSKHLIDHQVLSGQGYCFSASLSTCMVAAAHEALNMIQSHPEALEELQSNCSVMHDALTSSTILGKHFIISGASVSPVHLLVLRREIISSLSLHRDNANIVGKIVDSCREENVAIVGAASLKSDDSILTDSIRITTNIYHSARHIEHLVKVLENSCEKLFN